MAVKETGANLNIAVKVHCMSETDGHTHLIAGRGIPTIDKSIKDMVHRDTVSKVPREVIKNVESHSAFC